RPHQLARADVERMRVAARAGIGLAGLRSKNDDVLVDDSRIGNAITRLGNAGTQIHLAVGAKSGHWLAGTRIESIQVAAGISEDESCSGRRIAGPVSQSPSRDRSLGAISPDLFAGLG